CPQLGASTLRRGDHRSRVTALPRHRHRTTRQRGVRRHPLRRRGRHTEVADTMRPLDPREVGRYRILAALGEGGMGRVLLAVGPDGRFAAVKHIFPTLAHDPVFRARFRHEVSASRLVSVPTPHPCSTRTPNPTRPGWRPCTSPDRPFPTYSTSQARSTSPACTISRSPSPWR